MKAIVIKSKDEETWEQVGTQVWDSFDDAEEEAYVYIKKIEPDCDNYYFEVVGQSFFEKFKKPYL